MPKKRPQKDDTDHLMPTRKNSERLLLGVERAKQQDCFREKVEELRKEKEEIYRRIEIQANDPEVQKYYKDLESEF